MPPPRPPPDLRARHAALALAPRDLPLGRQGPLLRTALREAPTDAARADLIRAWVAAQDALHAAGFATDATVASTHLAAALTASPLHNVTFSPEHTWPLGTLHALRPVTAWHDRDELRTWLQANDASPAELALAPSLPPPWPGFPARPLTPSGAPATGLLALVGHPPELAAHAAHLAIPILPLTALLHPSLSTRHRLATALATAQPLLVPLATSEDLHDLPYFPTHLYLTTPSTPALPLTADDALALGIDPALVPTPQASPSSLPPPLPSPTQGFNKPDKHPKIGKWDSEEYANYFDNLPESTPSQTHSNTPLEPNASGPRRALEDAALLDDPVARARAEARALAAGLDDASLSPPDAAQRLSALLDRARAGHDRPTAIQALIRRALTAFDDPRQLFADLTEARRLALADQALPLAAATTALIALATALFPSLRAPFLDDPLPADAHPTTLIAARIIALSRTAVSDETFTSNTELLTLTQLLAPTEVHSIGPLASALAIELLAQATLLAAREEHAERLLVRALATRLAPPLRPLVAAWTTLCAARRGALATTRERLIALIPDLALAPHALGVAAAARAAFAAHLAHLDGLAAAALAHAPQAATSPTAGPSAQLAALAERHPLPPLAAILGHAPLALSLFLLEAAAAAPDAARRDALFASDALLLRHPILSTFAAFRLARAALAAPSDPDLAAELARTALDGEPHAERRALGVLAALGDERARARLAERDAATLPTSFLPPPPLTPAAAVAELISDLRTLGNVLAEVPVHNRWPAALLHLLGSSVDPFPTPAEATAHLQLVELPDGRVRLDTPHGPSAVFSPAAPLATPSRTAALLSALAPLFAAEATSPHSDARAADATTLARALERGDQRFFPDVVDAFKTHTLSRPLLHALIHHGLTETRGLYRSLAERWNIIDYQRFMDFLRRNQLQLDYRPYRRGAS